jgi:WD40 repeat protein
MRNRKYDYTTLTQIFYSNNMNIKHPYWIVISTLIAQHSLPVWIVEYSRKSTAFTITNFLYIFPSVDLSTKAQTVLSGTEHKDTIKCLEYWQDKQLLISGGWDRRVCLYDPRQSEAGKQSLVSSHELPERVYAMSVAQSMLVVGTAGRHIHIYDCRQMKEPFQRRESSLKFQTRAIRCFPDAKGLSYYVSCYVCVHIDLSMYIRIRYFID